MQQVQENADKNFSFLCAYRPSEKKFLRLADDDVRVVTLTPDSKYAVGVDIRNYEFESHLSDQGFEDVYTIDLKTGARKLAVKKARYVTAASPDGSHIAPLRRGVYYTYDASTGQSYNITKQILATFWDTEDDHNVVKPPHRPIGWAKDSSAVLLSDGWDIWRAPAHGGAGVNMPSMAERTKLRYRTRYRLDPDEKGIDLARPIYLNVYGEWTKKAGVAVIPPNGSAQTLVFDDASSGTLMKAKRANVYLYAQETVNEFPDYLIATNGGPGPKITDANPQQKDFLWVKALGSSSTRATRVISHKGTAPLYKSELRAR